MSERDIAEANARVARAVQVFHALGADPTWSAGPSWVSVDDRITDDDLRLAVMDSEMKFPPVVVVALSLDAIERLEAIAEEMRS